MSLSPQNTIRKVKKIYIYVNLGVFSTHVVDKGLIISIFKGASEIHVKRQVNLKRGQNLQIYKSDSRKQKWLKHLKRCYTLFMIRKM